jgi:hypothetical protein
MWPASAPVKVRSSAIVPELAPGVDAEPPVDGEPPPHAATTKSIATARIDRRFVDRIGDIGYSQRRTAIRVA